MSRNDGSTGCCSGAKATVAALVSDNAFNDERWCVALSGGADSLALTAVAAACKPTTALIVDHRLQRDSGRVATTAREQALSLGCVDAQVLCVDVGTVGGPEAAARTARYRALDDARRDAPVLLAHTLDDQAETVLLGLGRGFGARGRSPACGRAIRRGIARSCWASVARTTHAACAELGLTPWQDPHNADRRFTRTRLRNEVLPLLEEVLGGGVAEALARTATALREDTDTLDELARHVNEVGRWRARHRPFGGAAGGGPAQSDSRLAAGRRSRWADRQADPRGGHPGHGVAGSGRCGRRVAAAQPASGRLSSRRDADAEHRAGLRVWHAVVVSEHTAEQYPGDIKSVLLSSEAIQTKVAELGAQIGEDYRETIDANGQDLLLVTVLKGAVFFVTDLARKIPLPTQLEFMAVSS